MYDEDRELLAANGFEINEIPLSYTEADNARVFGKYNFADSTLNEIATINAIVDECEVQGLTDGYADIWATLTVLEAIGVNVEKFLDLSLDTRLGR